MVGNRKLVLTFEAQVKLVLAIITALCYSKELNINISLEHVRILPYPMMNPNLDAIKFQFYLNHSIILHAFVIAIFL